VRPQTVVLAAETALAGAILGGAALALTRSADATDGLIGAVLGLAGGQVVLRLAGVNRSILDSNPLPFFRGILRCVLTGLVLAGALFMLFPSFSHGLTGGLATWLLAAAFLALFRPILRALARHRLIQAVMILGPQRLTESLYQELSRGEDVARHDADGGIEITMSEECISRIVIADPRMSSEQDLATLIDSRMRGLRIEQAVESCESMRGKLWLEGLQPEWWIYSGGFAVTRSFRALKRVIDVTGTLALLVCLWPLLLATAIAIKLTSKGPVFYRQERVGLLGRPFMAVKFRSMRNDAESKSGPKWAAVNDDRITPLGHILRRFRIDELPQLFNVLRGEMSLVGPRPERQHFVEMLAGQIPYYNVRHYVRPGITGWAQVKYPYGASVSDAYEKLQYDLYYAKHLSLALDTLIMLKTLKVVLAGGGR
jgi:exopolysaccharide biosynthesis polyprenyl glycosylphosphotransferase